MPLRGETRPRVDPALSWRADLFALLGALADAETAGNETLSRHHVALLVRHWRRRPASPATGKRRR